MDIKPKIGLVVLNYNDYNTTLLFLDSVEKNRLIDFIVVVDNKSTDGSFEILSKRETNTIKVVSTEENRGYASGNNYGIEVLNNLINPEYIIIANPDVSFDESYIKEMLECFNSHKDTVAVAGVMNSSANINNPKIAWKLPTYSDLILSNLLIMRRFLGDRTLYKESYLLSDRFVRVDVIPGSLMFLSNEPFKEVGYFDTETFLYEEENILSHKLLSSGYELYIASKVSYEHNHAVSINKSIPNVGKRLDIGFKSREVYASKCLDIGFIKKTLLRITYRIGRFNYLICLRIINVHR